jgi:hypothetical protein
VQIRLAKNGVFLYSGVAPAKTYRPYDRSEPGASQLLLTAAGQQPDQECDIALRIRQRAVQGSKRLGCGAMADS